MASYRDRDTFVHRHGVTPETMSVISSKAKLYAVPADAGARTAYQVGVVATFDPSETRAIEPVRGIGFGDHVAELVPGMTDPMTITVTRTAQYLTMIYQVFGYKGGIDGLVRSLRHHKYPFDLKQEIVISRVPMIVESVNSSPGKTGGGIHQSSDKFDIGKVKLDAIITYYEGCWMSDYSTSYASDTALVQESVTLNVTDIVADPSIALSEDLAFFNMPALSAIMASPKSLNAGAGPFGG